MRNRVYLFLVIVLLFSARSQAQTLESLAQSNGSQRQAVNGVVATFSSFAEGRANADGVLRFNGTDDNTIQSVLINLSTGVYIGYTLAVERLPDPNKLKIEIKPLPEDSAEIFRESVAGKMLALKWPNRSGYDPAPPPSYPEPIEIDMSDVVKIPLWAKAGAEWGVIGDQIRFAVDRPEPKPARDFTIDDVTLKLTHFRLFINGELRSGEREIDGFEAATPAFYAPGKGTFVLSIRPVEGADFQKIGVVEGNKVRFSYGCDTYEWVSGEPVIPYGGKWSLWVLHDTSLYLPSPEMLEASKLLSKGNCCVYVDMRIRQNDKLTPAKK